MSELNPLKSDHPTDPASSAGSDPLISSDVYHTFFEHAPFGMFMTCPDGEPMRINRACADLLGYTTDEMNDVILSEIVFPEDSAKSTEARRALTAVETEIRKTEKRCRHRRGHWVFTRVSTRLFRNADSSPPSFLNPVKYRHQETEPKAPPEQLRDDVEALSHPRDRFSGNGRGLKLSRRLALRHGGSLKIDSSSPLGTGFF